MLYTNKGCGTARWRVKCLRYVGASMIRVSFKTTMSYRGSMPNIQL